jgi:hypothetical protein
MTGRSWVSGTVTVVIILGLVFGYRWWASDERVIRKQMSQIAQSLTIAPNEGALGPVTRLGMLRKVLAPDIRVSGRRLSGGDASAPQPEPEEIVGRDTVLALASRWLPAAGGVTVEFVDVQITVAQGRATAQVYGTAKVTSRGVSGQPTVDAIELTAGFTNADGTWLVSWVRPEDTLVR